MDILGVSGVWLPLPTLLGQEREGRRREARQQRCYFSCKVGKPRELGFTQTLARRRALGCELDVQEPRQPSERPERGRVVARGPRNAGGEREFLTHAGLHQAGDLGSSEPGFTPSRDPHWARPPTRPVWVRGTSLSASLQESISSFTKQADAHRDLAPCFQRGPRSQSCDLAQCAPSVHLARCDSAVKPLHRDHLL